MTPDMAELLHRYRRLIRELDGQLVDLRAGAIRFFRGDVDATPEAIALAERQKADLQRLVDKYDPEGWTIVRDKLPKDG